MKVTVLFVQYYEQIAVAIHLRLGKYLTLMTSHFIPHLSSYTENRNRTAIFLLA